MYIGSFCLLQRAQVVGEIDKLLTLKLKLLPMAGDRSIFSWFGIDVGPAVWVTIQSGFTN